ncbi:hypothetical protein PLICRDRAFT_54759 [Plicaturopsis crispa FD-325 SS-3]|nr:hypothetical protein PLICRDRAFT_54759 [Plicaturopsis crispa FD-325 SS-3]
MASVSAFRCIAGIQNDHIPADGSALTEFPIRRQATQNSPFLYADFRSSERGAIFHEALPASLERYNPPIASTIILIALIASNRSNQILN